MNSNEQQEVVCSKMEPTTAAAPGIDLEQFREVVEYRYSAELAAFERGCRSEGHLEREESERNRLLALIDASPKGGSDAQNAARYRWLRDKAMMGTRHDPAVLKEGPTDCCEFFWGEELDAAVDAAMQATSAEVGA